jgi:hypothetical protein
MSKEKTSALYRIVSCRNYIHKFEEKEDFFFLVDSMILLCRNIQNDKLVSHLALVVERIVYLLEENQSLITYFLFWKGKWKEDGTSIKNIYYCTSRKRT